MWYWNVKKGKHLVKFKEIETEENQDDNSKNVV